MRRAGRGTGVQWLRRPRAEGEATEAAASVRLDVETAWRHFFNALDRSEAERRVVAAGDEELCDAFFAVRSVMV